MSPPSCSCRFTNKASRRGNATGNLLRCYATTLAEFSSDASSSSPPSLPTMLGCRLCVPDTTVCNNGTAPNAGNESVVGAKKTVQSTVSCRVRCTHRHLIYYVFEYTIVSYTIYMYASHGYFTFFLFASRASDSINRVFLPLSSSSVRNAVCFDLRENIEVCCSAYIL